MNNDLVYRLRKRAEIRRGITTRKSVQNNEPDRIAGLLDEAADMVEMLEQECSALRQQLRQMESQVYGGVSQ
jgi:polyhydroxyalkanoate synthesis regulator phasin